MLKKEFKIPKPVLDLKKKTKKHLIFLFLNKGKPAATLTFNSDTEGILLKLRSRQFAINILINFLFHYSGGSGH